ncbi:TPA: hypothetical protein HA234_04265 [Candidatus Woesearchaeota archaeon]|nr:hypothetical protein [Candidatus Woesearchaeota archaeon]
MKVYQQTWWKKMFSPEKHEKREEVLKDIETIAEFLQDTKDDVKQLKPLLEKLEELEKERQVASSGLLHVNLEAQAEVLDKLLQRYEFFQNDADVNGMRVKRIAQEWLKHAQKAGLKDLVQKKKKDLKWHFDW